MGTRKSLKLFFLFFLPFLIAVRTFYINIRRMIMRDMRDISAAYYRHQQKDTNRVYNYNSTLDTVCIFEYVDIQINLLSPWRSAKLSKHNISLHSTFKRQKYMISRLVVYCAHYRALFFSNTRKRHVRKIEQQWASLITQWLQRPAAARCLINREKVWMKHSARNKCSYIVWKQNRMQGRR